MWTKPYEIFSAVRKLLDRPGRACLWTDASSSWGESCATELTAMSGISHGSADRSIAG